MHINAVETHEISAGVSPSEKSAGGFEGAQSGMRAEKETESELEGRQVL